MVTQTRAFEILDITAHIVYAKDEESALKYFYEGKTSKGDSWPEVRQLGIDRPSYFVNK